MSPTVPIPRKIVRQLATVTRALAPLIDTTAVSAHGGLRANLTCRASCMRP